MNENVRKDIEALRSFLVDDCIDFPHVIHTALHKAAYLIESLSAQLDQVTRERDAAVEDLKEADRLDCEHCISYKMFGSDLCDEVNFMCSDCNKECRCKTCKNNSNWQWRGVEVEGCLN